MTSDTPAAETLTGSRDRSRLSNRRAHVAQAVRASGIPRPPSGARHLLALPEPAAISLLMTPSSHTKQRDTRG